MSKDRTIALLNLLPKISTAKDLDIYIFRARQYPDEFKSLAHELSVIENDYKNEMEEVEKNAIERAKRAIYNFHDRIISPELILKTDKK